ncbi:winged helix-turn-helix domain-containing protein [Thaumasiovibrio subtropicus]|uniref:winged helix-turn-helix domain-containing protein n=1 Tax=Thaumasiovibrio subtropicus TaxID=1891207 RepID=UPI000B359ED0|nr:winged helix-turn-helix domain-containing protein [Thaumasiovibrio subtropicus]
MTSKVDKLLIGKRFLFDPADNSLIDQLEDNELIRLGTNESRALQLLAEEPGAVITRQHLHNFVWRQQGFEVDDSSITQAISTLRKALKDSTKSPEFIKTVPKRGYQIIADIEPYQAPEALDEVSIPLNVLPSTETPVPLTADLDETLKPAATGGRTQFFWMNLLVVIMSVLIPIFAFKTSPTTSSSFDEMFVVEGIPVIQPSSHPDFDQWEALITQCVTNYATHHPDELRPEKVIVTDGRNNQIFLNYIHKPLHSIENMTIRLLPKEKDNSELCQ